MQEESKMFLVDIDGVACEHAKAICDWVNRTYKTDSEVEDVLTWNHDFGPITFDEAVKVCYPQRDFILGMQVTPGFKKFLQAIRSMFITRFVTKRGCSHDATRDWVKKHFGELDIHFVRSKKEVEFDCLIDDSMEDIITVASMAGSKGRKCFLLKRPWNDSRSIRRKLRGFRDIHFVETFADVWPFLTWSSGFTHP